MSFLSVQGETPRHTSSATPSLHSNRTSIPSLRSNRSNPQKKKQHANGSTAHEQLFAVLRRLCTSCMITALDFVERHNPSLNDPNMFNINSAILESDPLNPPTLTSTEFWALVKERSGIDPPDWQKTKCFHKLDIRRTGTISYARLKAGATLFDPDLTMDKSVQRRSSNVAMQKWIDVSASDCMNTLSRKLRRKHNTDLGHELYAHFVRACVPASVSAKMNDKHQKINFAHFVRGLKAHNVLDFSKTSSHQTMKKLFSSLDHENKGHVSINTKANMESGASRIWKALVDFDLYSSSFFQNCFVVFYTHCLHLFFIFNFSILFFEHSTLDFFQRIRATRFRRWCARFGKSSWAIHRQIQETQRRTKPPQETNTSTIASKIAIKRFQTCHGVGSFRNSS